MRERDIIKTIVYRQITQGAVLCVNVTELFDNSHYRVELYEEYDAHSIEITDLWLRRPSHRRWLEEYVRIRNVKKIYFGPMCGNLYSLEGYLRNYNFETLGCPLDYLKDLKFEL